ncbi:MAG: hypothetical protein ACJAZN_001786 [Planctomycetota bacterium]|jgi:hypothetical protein
MQIPRLALALLAAPGLALCPCTLATPGSAVAAAFQGHDVKVSPFDGLRWAKDQPEVNVDGTWYRPISIDGVSVESILEFCDKRWPRQRKKRFGEDMAEAMGLMGHETGRTAKLELVQLDSGAEVTLDEVEMTRAKRQAIRNGPKVSAAPAVVPRDVAEQEVDAFGRGLTTQFAYLERKGVDLDAALKDVLGSLPDEVPVTVLAEKLDRVLKRFGDGHAGVSARGGADPGQHLPFLLDVAGDGIVAFDPNRRGLVDEGRPYVQAIDGRPIADWIESMSGLVVDGSPQLVEHRALRAMREIELIRSAIGEDASDEIVVTLSSRPKGGKRTKKTLKLQRRRPTYGPWPRTETRHLSGKDANGAEGGIGVIRIPQMDNDLIPAVREAMDDFRGTAGLIIDVRGNGGGSRGLCAALAGYLVPEDAKPVVGNCAAYRLAPDFRRDHLGGSRLMYRADDAHWNAAQKDAIASFAKGFKPEWKLPDGFSEWHYLVLDRTGHNDEYFYASPVVVLVDEACFSATDIFAAALGELQGVTLMGMATGGGSARTERFMLPRTGIQVRCASMASFQPSGRLYDGNGVAVDVEVQRDPGDLLLGGGDAQLAAAVKRLSGR